MEAHWSEFASSPATSTSRSAPCRGRSTTAPTSTRSPASGCATPRRNSDIRPISPDAVCGAGGPTWSASSSPAAPTMMLDQLGVPVRPRRPQATALGGGSRSGDFSRGRRDDRLEPLRRVTERGLVDALIIADTLGRDPRVEYLTKLDKPFVAFGRTRSPFRTPGSIPILRPRSKARSTISRSLAIAGSRSRSRISNQLHRPDRAKLSAGDAAPGTWPSTKPGACGRRRASGAVSPPRKPCSRPIHVRPRSCCRFDACSCVLPPARGGRIAARSRPLDRRDSCRRRGPSRSFRR